MCICTHNINIWLRARFRRYFLRCFLHVVICTQKSCESDSVSVCCTSKSVETFQTLQGLPGASAHGHGAWSRSLVAELRRGASSRSLVAEQLVGGAEAVKRAMQRDPRDCILGGEDSWGFWGYVADLQVPPGVPGGGEGGGGWGLLGLLGVCG